MFDYPEQGDAVSMSGESQSKPSGETWERASPASAEVSTKIEPKQLLILLVLSLSLAIIVIDATIVIVAQYRISQDFKINLKDLEWITSLYALVFGSFLLTWGKLSDEFGRKRIFISGISLFIVGSIIDGFSQDLTQILVGRVIQGFGAAMASPSTLSILTTTFTGKARGVAFGIWGATAGAAAVLGPVLGGYFTSTVGFTWRWAFFINIPIGITALVGAAFAIKETRFKDPKYTTDYLGLILITIGLSSLLFGFIEAQTYGWIVPASEFHVGGFSWSASNLVSLPLVAIIFGLILLLVFTFYEIRRLRRGKVPLFDFSLLKFKGFRYGLFTVTIVAMGEFGAVFIISIFLQTVKGLSAFTAGLTFLPMAISVFIFAPVAGLLATRFGPKWIVTAGMTLEAIALFSMSQIISVANPVYYLYPILVIYGAGVGLAISQLTSTVLLSIPWQKAGVGSGANNTVRQIGSAFGIAVIGAVLVAQISAVGMADLTASTANFGIQRSALAAALNSGLSGGIDPSFIASFGGNASAVLSILYDAITQGTRWAAFTAGIFVSLGAISSLLIPNPKSAQTTKTTVVASDSHREASRALTAVIITQFAITVSLLLAISNEYQSNYFMRQWVSQNASPLGYFLADYVGPALAAIVGGVLIAWKLVLTRRQSEAKSEPNN
ncbi:MFS transporter [Candidatus Bathyarchaeota archaeon]|nr:MAG: MFS transporter [Candidatus Bathyarchaeota archaeon]